MTAEEVNLGLCHVPELFRNPTNMQMELEIYPSPDTITQPIVKDRYKISKEDLWTEYHLPETLQYFQTKGRPQALPKFASRMQRAMNGRRTVSWVNQKILSAPASYMVGQIAKKYATLVLELNNETNKDLGNEGPLLLQMKTNPFLASVSAPRLLGYERLYEDRIALRNSPQRGELASARVDKISGRYYLPEAFERIERGGYQLGNNRYWITKIRDPKYETTNGNIPHMLHTLKVTDSEQRQDYETLLNSSAIFALEHVKFIL
ncbi:unnamed protein product [Enterobius vermicularis]|uniref:Phage major capsid protein n=1 Tax=Enterobius vermicularis TaxID=51028 RepID=A0A0N4V1B8_ENTVE|nr:unnamed protein product [Enterobius vermicularis]